MIFSGLYAITISCFLLAAGLGVDFSPSFTAMFLMVFLAAEAISEICRCFNTKKRKAGLSLAKSLASIIGILFVIPSVIIYAAGDDWMGACIRIALLVPLLLYTALYFYLFRKRGKKTGIAAGVAYWLLLTAAVLTLLCAVPSTALWPYGFGLLSIWAAKLAAGLEADERFIRGATTLGMFLCTMFLVAPMVF